jgi:hypothetical protein
MRLRKCIFRILLPVIYLGIAILFVGGAIGTIFEGPNPFGFLFYPAFYPGSYLLAVLPTWLLPLEVNDWIGLLIVATVNVGFYFVVGYLIDQAINRLGAYSPRAA